MDECQREIETVLNRYCKENDSNTPDFILATYLMDCLNAFNNAVSSREKWYNNKLEDEIVEENGGAFINSNEIPEKKEVNIFDEENEVENVNVKKEVNVFEVDEDVQDETTVSETTTDVNDFWNS